MQSTIMTHLVDKMEHVPYPATGVSLNHFPSYLPPLVTLRQEHIVDSDCVALLSVSVMIAKFIRVCDHNPFDQINVSNKDPRLLHNENSSIRLILKFVVIVDLFDYIRRTFPHKYKILKVSKDWIALEIHDIVLFEVVQVIPNIEIQKCTNNRC